MKLQIVIQGSNKDFNKLTKVAKMAEDLKLTITFSRAYQRVMKQRLKRQLAKIDAMFSSPDEPFSLPVTRVRIKSPLS